MAKAMVYRVHISLPAVMFLSFVLAGCVRAAPMVNPFIDSLLLLGVDWAQKQEYQKADSVFDRVPKDHPGGDLLKVVALQAVMMENHDYRCSGCVYRPAKSAAKKAENMIAKNPRSAEAYFYRGNAYGVIGTYDVYIGKWYSSFSNGVKGISGLKRCLEYDSTFFDAYAGLGIFHYYKGRATRYLNWLPFMNDERAQGMRELATAVEKGRYFSHTARYSLLWCYYTEKRFDEALALAEGFLRQYPRNTIFLRARADILFQKGEWKNAAAAYALHLNVLSTRPTPNRLEEVESSYKMGYALEQAGDKEKAAESYRAVLSLPVAPWATRDAKDHQERAAEGLERLGVK